MADESSLANLPMDRMDQSQGSAENHRYYESEYPVLEELVLARITRIEDMGAYAQLIEYGGKEGMLLLSELSKRRFRSVNKLIKVGRVEYVMVIRVDEEKGYIDLSKKRVTQADIPKAEQRYSDSKKVNLIVRNTAEKVEGVTISDLYREVIWPLGRNPAFQHPLEGLMKCYEDSTAAFAHVDREKIPQEAIDIMISEVMSRMQTSSLKMRAFMDVSCSGYDGVHAIKKAINQGVEESDRLVPTSETEPDTKASDLSVRLIAPPRFLICCTDYDKDRGLARIAKVLEVVSQAMSSIDGGFAGIVGEITVTGDEEEEAEAEEESSESYSDEEIDEGMGVVAEEL